MTTPEPPPKEPLDDDEDDEKTRTVADGSPARWAREHSFNHSAPRPPSVAPDRTYRVALLGFSLCSDKLPGVLDHAYARAFADHPGPRIALHAGVAYGPEPWPTGTDEVHRAAAALVADCGPGRERTVNLDGLCLGLLVCGENNVLTNQQGQGNRVLVRHDESAHLFEGVRVVFNGGHSTMGNWGKMDERFRYLSRKRRWAFYATNCGNNGWGRSTVRAYHDGVLIADSLGPRETPPAGVPEPRLVYDDVDDRCLALVLDIPGRMLA